MTQPQSMDGIISYLTKKHGGNVHDKGIVRITSKSVWDEGYSVRNVADLTDDRYFISENKSGQWIRWDFLQVPVRPTHYSFTASQLHGWNMKSWSMEGSLDGEVWTEIDRQTDNRDFEKDGAHHTAWFAFSKTMVCRFIRMTHRGNHDGSSTLALFRFELFGALFE
jgi:hypothetical protein